MGLKILESIIELTQSAEEVTNRLETHRSHRMGLETIANTYKAEIGDKPVSQPNKSRKSLRRETLRTTGSFSGRLKESERRNSVSKPEGFEALETLLRRLGLSLSALLDAAESGLSAGGSLHEKKQRMLEMASSLHNGVDEPLSAHLDAIDRASQLLSSALHADSEFNISLTENAQETKLADLESQIGLVKKGIEGINLDILQRDKAQEKFLERWL